MNKIPAVIRNNQPTEGQYTVLSVHGTWDEATVELIDKYPEENDVKIEFVAPDRKRGDVGDMTDFPPPQARTHGGRDIAYDV